MRVVDLYRRQEKTISVEFTPPRNGSSLDDFDASASRLRGIASYASITHGAGGALRGGTLPLAARLQDRHGLPCLPHISCRWMSREQAECMVMDARYLGLESILALRGDPPSGSNGAVSHPDSHPSASDFVDHLARIRLGEYMRNQVW